MSLLDNYCNLRNDQLQITPDPAFSLTCMAPVEFCTSICVENPPIAVALYTPFALSEIIKYTAIQPNEAEYVRMPI